MRATEDRKHWGQLRARIERGLEAWGHTVYRHPWRVILGSLLAVGALAAQLPTLEIDTSSESFLEPDHPTRIQYNAFRQQFGSEEFAMVAVRTDEVFELGFLEQLRAFHEALEEEVPHVEEVTSLVNVRNTYAIGDELRVDDFLEDWPQSPAELLPLRARALANPLYRDVLISDDARITAVLVEAQAFSSLGQDDDVLLGFEEHDDPGADPETFIPLTGPENTEFVRAIEGVAARFEAAGFEIHIAGQPPVTDRIMGQMIADMARFTGISLVVMAGVLAFLFRSAMAVLLSLGTSLLAIVCGFSFMAASGVALTTPTQITPSFLLAVGVGNSVHLLVIFLQQRSRDRDVESALAYALGHSGLAILMTGLTTAGSLASFQGASLAMVADFGWVGPAGVLLALALTLVLLPALMAVTPMRGRPVEDGWLRRLPVACGALGARHPGATLAAWLLLFAVAGSGLFQLRFSNDPVSWFPREEPLRIAMELIDTELGGAQSFELVVDSGHENGLYEPELLRRIETAQSFAEGQPLSDGKSQVGRTTISIVQVVKEIHQALNEGRSDAYRIPDDRGLVAQELFLFESSGTDDLEDVVDSQFRTARVSIKLPVLDSIHAVDLLETLEEGFAGIFEGQAHFHLTGQNSIGVTTTMEMIHSLSRTYLLAFAIITPFMMLLLGSVRTGLLSMLPAIGAIQVTLGLMGWLDMPLEAFTLLTGCIALGLAVDDTIHFMHNYARAHQAGMESPEAIRTTLASTGQALLFTSLVLVAGFLIYTQATLTMLFNFGLSTAFAIGLAFLANVTLAPALVTLVARWQRGVAPPN